MSELRPALVVFALLTLLTGVLYPLIMTGVGQLVFPRQANGSEIRIENRSFGSRLMGQPFSGAKYFWSRPSATAPQPYNAAASGGSNRGPLNPALLSAVQDRIAALHRADPGNSAPVPVDLVTASASGLDPHISPAAAEYQVARVARERSVPEEKIRKLVLEATQGRTLGILGEPRVNVLELNLMLDAQLAR